MSHKGNITFRSLDFKYDDESKTYSLNGVVKEFDADYEHVDKIIMDYYVDLGYYFVLNYNCWRKLFEYFFWEDVTGETYEESSKTFLEFGELEKHIPFSIDEKNFKNQFDYVLEISDKYLIVTHDAFSNNLNKKHLNEYQDFLKPFFNKQSDEVKESFLKSIKPYLSEDYDKGWGEDDELDYDWFLAFSEYFGDDFTNFMNDEFKKHGIKEKFKENIFKHCFSKLSQKQILAIMQRMNLNQKTIASFYPYVAYNGDEFLFAFHGADYKDWTNEEKLWIDFLLSIGCNVEIFAFNRSNKSLSRSINKFKENTVKLELFGFDDVNLDYPQLKKIDKLTIKDFPSLKDEMELLSQENDEDLIIKVNGEEVSFEDIYDVFLCTLEKEENHLSKDYCCDYVNFKSKDFTCRYVKEEFNSNKFTIENNHGIITDDGIWEFNKDFFENKFQELVKVMKICPFFEYPKNKTAIGKFLRDIRPETKTHWCFLDENGHTWFFLRKRWFNEKGNMNFPGFSKMIGIKKTNFKTRDKAVEIVDKKLK